MALRFWVMQATKSRGEAWSLTDVANATGLQRGRVSALARRVLPSRLLENRAGRGAAVQLPESVALALVDTLRLGVLDSRMVAALKDEPAAVLAAAEGLAELVRLVEGETQAEAA